MVLKGPKKRSWSSLRCKDKGHTLAGPDLMVLVNKNDCYLPIKQCRAAQAHEKKARRQI